MQVFVARQPIFDSNLNVVAYELLFRDGFDNYYKNTKGDDATLSVIDNVLNWGGVSEVVDNKKAFINFTENLLKQDIAMLLPKDKVVIEILEDIEPTPEVLEACMKLKQNGYIIALDDFVFEEKYRPLIDLADIIKVDFIISQGNERYEIINSIKNPKVKFLAEKVETRAEFEEAKKNGYSFFQGYFFSKPVVISKKSIPTNAVSYFRIIKEVMKEEIDYDAVENAIKQDPSTTYKILKYVNSAYFGFRHQISSLRQALPIIGRYNLTKLIPVLSVNALNQGKPEELLVKSIIRGKFAELIAPYIGMKQKADDVFLMGIFSLMDAFMDKPKFIVLNEMPLPLDIIGGLLGEDNIYGHLYNFIIAYEEGDWDRSRVYADILGIDINLIPDIYFKAIEWSGETMNY